MNASLPKLNGPNDLSIQAISSSCLTLLVLIYESISSGLTRSKSKIWPFAHDKKDRSLAKPSVKDSDSDDVVTYNFSFFHFVMLVSATHVMINLTNWYVPDSNSMDFKTSWTAVLVKMISSAASVWVYIWTLIAPVLQSIFYSTTRSDEESSICSDSKGQGESGKSQASAAEMGDQMKTVPSHLDAIQIQNKEGTDNKHIPVRPISSNNESVKVSHGSMSRKSSLHSLSPKSDTEREMLRLQNKVITLQEKIAKLQTKVATLQGLNI
ncbi:uncharacterized protein LOC116307521 [Actinia tenebrosa]|uniref:Uncharacterized protein LOC116307521 n=1 Tax=Actinia tenebrosa TaxID=6105 RepID=A0A6P8J183_ACTTE|nr:uncharacterized protein LOC116307521 [Actinia tenebrosa]